MDAFHEGQKLLFDVFKHITTLCTGAVILLATLLSDVFSPSSSPCLALVVFSSFSVSNVFSLISMALLCGAIQRGGRPSATHMNAGIWTMLIAAAGFLVAMLSLACFAAINFLTQA